MQPEHLSDKSEFSVQLSALVYGGNALGRLPDGRAVFVPFGLPGEQVRIRLVSEKRGHAQAELLEVLQPSPLRVAPSCKHFGVCGGCQYQHMTYAQQLVIKAAILGEQLERIGGISSPPVEACVPCANPTRYRNHVQFHLTPEGRLGYYRWDEQSVFPIEECLLPEASLDAVWRLLDFEGLADIDRVGLRVGMEGDLQLIFESQDFEAPQISVEELDLSVVHLSPAGRLVLAGSEAIFAEVLGKIFRLTAGSFFQVNTRMAEIMVDYLLADVELTPEMTVLDLYCGVGLFSAFLAERVGRLIGIEASPTACDDFVYNLDAYDHVELYEATVESVLPEINIRPDLVILDPPRAGVNRHALEHLVKMAPPVLVYVSCDPATLGRDSKRLRDGGYRLKKITPFDLFPQTYHIESISIWKKEYSLTL